MTHPIPHISRHGMGYAVLLLLLALGVGGGYAAAASRTKTVSVCADKKTGILHLHNHGKCKRSQTRVTWNQQGPQGPQGVQGQAGTPAVSVWANVANAGAVVSGQGLSVQHVAAGTYQVTITAPQCAHGANAPVITVGSTHPPGGQVAGAFPVAWYQSTSSNQQFNVSRGWSRAVRSRRVITRSR